MSSVFPIEKVSQTRLSPAARKLAPTPKQLMWRRSPGPTEAHPISDRAGGIGSTMKQDHFPSSWHWDFIRKTIIMLNNYYHEIGTSVQRIGHNWWVPWMKLVVRPAPNMGISNPTFDGMTCGKWLVSLSLGELGSSEDITQLSNGNDHPCGLLRNSYPAMHNPNKGKDV
jgi:hypothetical protein